MKIRSTLITLLAAICVTITACQKENEVTPISGSKLQIEKVVTSSTGNDLYIDQYYIKPARPVSVELISSKPTITNSTITFTRENVIYTAYRKGKNTSNQISVKLGDEKVVYTYNPNDPE